MELSKGKNKSNKKNEYPSKQTLNLVIKEIPPNYYKNLTMYAVAGAIFIGLFCKFLVIDRLAKESAAWQEVNRNQRYLDSLESQNAKYPEVLADYEKYFASSSTAKTTVDALEVLRIIDDRLIPASNVRSMSLSANTLTVVLTGIDLERASWIMDELLSNEPLVSAINLRSAATDSDEVSAVSMVIVLDPEGGSVE